MRSKGIARNFARPGSTRLADCMIWVASRVGRRSGSHNIIDARGVITWKMIGGNVGATCRLIVRGVKDAFRDVDTYAGTISRSGHRLVNAIVAEHRGFILFSFDVSPVFVK